MPRQHLAASLPSSPAREGSGRLTVTALIPRIQLASAAFEARHRALRIVLWLHLPVVVSVALLGGHAGMSALLGRSGPLLIPGMSPQSVLSARLIWAFIAVAGVCAVLSNLPRSARMRAFTVSVGLLMCADTLVHAGGGQTDLHFYFFVILALIGLYQDWAPFAFAVFMVALHHGVVGVLAPGLVYSSPSAQTNPVWFAALHAFFVLVMSAAQITYWHFTHRSDVERRRANDEATRLALIARHAENGIVLMNTDGVIEWVNDAFCKITGTDASAAIGRSRSAMLSSAGGDVAQVRRLMSGSAEHVRSAEVLTARPDGAPLWLHLEITPIRDGDGVSRLVSVERDITARRQAEDELRTASRQTEALAVALEQERSLLAKVINAIPHLVYWKDAGGCYRGVNDAFGALRPGLAGVRVLGRTEEQVGILDPLGEALAEVEQEVLTTGDAVHDRRVTLTDLDGRTRELLLSVLPQVNPDGSPEGLIGVGADVTHVSELERQLAQATRLESIGQLAAGIAHEINTPVQFVADNTRFIAESLNNAMPALLALARGDGPDMAGEPDRTPGRPPGPRSAEVDLAYLADEIPIALAESLEGLERVAQIVKAMKDFSHPGEGRSDADLNRAIESTVHVSRNEWKYCAEVVLDLAPDTGLVPCREGELKQAILNIVVNAAHAIQARLASSPSSEPGLITIRTRRTGEAVEIEISDNGIGMDRQTQQRVFDPFFTTKEVGKGTGQGLSLARDTIVNRHSGAISVRSAPGQGTTFTIVLPLTRKPGPGTPPANLSAGARR